MIARRHGPDAEDQRQPADKLGSKTSRHDWRGQLPAVVGRRLLALTEMQEIADSRNEEESAENHPADNDQGCCGCHHPAPKDVYPHCLADRQAAWKCPAPRQVPVGFPAGLMPPPCRQQAATAPKTPTMRARSEQERFRKPGYRRKEGFRFADQAAFAAGIG